MTPRAAALAALLGLAAACGRDRTGRLEAAWTRDSATGRMAAPAAAVRCDAARLLVTAVAGDTGFGVLVLAADSLATTMAPGSYPVADPGAGPLPRPGAALALRMPGEGGTAGYQGRKGSLELRADGPGSTGRFEGLLVSLDEAESLSVTGRFGVAGPVPAGACDDSAAAGPPAGALP